MRELRRLLRGTGRALAGFLRGFLGLGGTPGARPLAPSADAEAARRALEERAARRRSCC